MELSSVCSSERESCSSAGGQIAVSHGGDSGSPSSLIHRSLCKEELPWTLTLRRGMQH